MHKLISAFLLIICLSSFAFAEVRMNSLGDYFHYLVPDVETDIELFPTHLNFWEQRNIMLKASGKSSHNKIDLNVYPLLGKISYGMKTSFASRGKSYPLYENYRSDYYYSLSNDSEFDIKNYLCLQINNSFYIGMKFDWVKGWETGKSFSETTNRPDYDYYYRKHSDDEDLDDDTYSAGFNLHFGNILRKDISLSYSKNDYNELDKSEYIYEREYSSGQRYFDSTLSHESQDSNNEEYQINILFEKMKMRKFRRLYLSSLYSIEDAVSKYHSEDVDEFYMDGDTLTSADWNYYDEGITTESKYYQTVLGWGQNWIRNNLQLFYGIRFQGSYEKMETDKYNHSKNIHYYYDSYYDSTTIDTTTYKDTLSNIVKKNWQGSIILPLGMEYKLKDNLTLYCGFGYQISRRLVRNTHGDFYYWITDAYQSAGLKYNPLKKLELGINFNGNLASFNKWQVEIRYLF